MDKKNTVSFKRKLSPLGGSSIVAIPKELCEFLNAPDGSTLRVAGYNGKHGKYVAFWVDEEKGVEKNE